MTEKEDRLFQKLVCAAGWLNRAQAKYRDEPPGMDKMSSKGNRALDEASIALRDALEMMRGEENESYSEPENQDGE